MDFETQRMNMVESQVRPSDITDRRIIRAMLEIPRESFVPAASRSLAYIDADLPLPHAAHARDRERRALLAPRTLAKLIQLAAIEPGDAVLDVGAMTGYASAVMARIAGTVMALECDAALARDATRSLSQLACDNVTVTTGELTAGAPQDAPYDAILVEGAVEEVPQALLDQLKDEGRLVAVVARGALGRATVWHRLGGTFSGREAFDATAPRLASFARPSAFAL